MSGYLRTIYYFVCVFQLAAKQPNWELTIFAIIPINPGGCV